MKESENEVFPQPAVCQNMISKIRWLIYCALIFAVLVPFNSFGQNTRLVSGTTKDNKGQPLPGVTVLVKGTTIGTVSDINGNFQLNIPENAQLLEFSFVGMKRLELPATGRSSFDVVLIEESIGVDEVVVVGYGTQKKANLTGAVDQVTSEVFEGRSMPNINQGLKGVVPNLNIMLMDGKPTQAPQFNIRGTTSIGQGGNALVLIDGVEGNPSMLNPNDIASISILKDAASAAIYGARGTFGVVLITTKNPTQGKTNVTYSTNYSLKDPIVRPDLVTDGYTWAKMFAESFISRENSMPQNVNKTLKFSQAYLDAWEARKGQTGLPEVEIHPTTGEYVYYASTDWYKELYKDKTNSQEHNITISGSTDKTSLLITGRYYAQDGLFRYNSDDFNVKNIRSKGSVQLFPWLRIDNNADFSDMFYHNPSNVGEGGGIWRNIADEGHPLAPMFNPDGTLTMSAVYTVGDFWYGKNGIDSRRKIFKNTTGFNADFLNSRLNVKGDFTIQNTNFNEKRRQVPVPYSNKPGVIAYVGTTTNDLRDINTETQYIAGNLYADFEETFREKHYFKLLVGYNYEESTWQRYMAQRNGLIFEDARDMNLALGQSITVQGGYEKWAIMGGFSRLNYSFNDRYLVEINARYDGSSKFPENERYGFFPSYSAGWRLSNESFWNVPERLISDLKIRASYGSLGNGNIGSYVYQEQFSISQSGIILGGTRPQQTRNPSVLPDGLTWETSTTQNIGLDMTMVNRKLSFVADAYMRKTTDMFTIGMTLPAIFGATAPKGNYADLETTGWEAVLTWRDRLNLKSKPFSYDVRLTLADNKSVITKYNNPDKLLSDYYEGMVLGEIWGYVTEGYFTSLEDIANSPNQSPTFRTTANSTWFPGDLKFKNLNDDNVINAGTNRVDNPGDRKIIGNSAPRYMYGINLGADWNNFNFSVFFQGVGKQDWYPSAEANLFWGQYTRPYGDIPKTQLGNIWSADNPDAYWPRYVSRIANNADGPLRAPQTKYLQNVAYIRMKNIQFGYDIPRNLISKISAENARLYISAENIWTYTPLYKISKNFDVENAVASDQVFTSSNSGDAYNYPMLKSITLGLSITF
jgi:TonB-linked SusC/RagA family outer membrane protein